MKRFALVVFLLVSAAAASNALAGRIVVANDEWTVSDTGFASPNDPGRFVQNIGAWFGGGSFLVYSNNFSYGSDFLDALTNAGSVNILNPTVSPLPDLSPYSGVFLAGNPADNGALVNYVLNGGDVYLAGGTGVGGAAAEAAQWNTFLHQFGLEFGAPYNGISGNIPIQSAHPIFAGVDSLYQNSGNPVGLYGSNPAGQVLVPGLYAVYDPVTPVPEPATLLLLGCGLIGMGGYARKRFA